MAVPEFLWHCSRDSKVTGSDILEVLMILSLCRRNAQNYRQNDCLLETCFSVSNLVVDTLYDTLITFLLNQWLLRLIWRLFRLCVWIWICVSNMCRNNNSLIFFLFIFSLWSIWNFLVLFWVVVPVDDKIFWHFI